MYVLEVRHAELMESLTKQAAELGITNAAIVTLIGAVDSFTVSTNPAADSTAHTYSTYPLPAEMTAYSASAGLGAPVRFCVSQRDGEETRIDIDLPTSFFCQFPELRASSVPTELDERMLPLLERVAS